MGRSPCEDGGRDWSDVATSRGVLGATGSSETRHDAPLEPWGEAWIRPHLAVEF